MEEPTASRTAHDTTNAPEHFADAADNNFHQFWQWQSSRIGVSPPPRKQLFTHLLGTVWFFDFWHTQLPAEVDQILPWWSFARTGKWTIRSIVCGHTPSRRSPFSVRDTPYASGCKSGRSGLNWSCEGAREKERESKPPLELPPHISTDFMAVQKR